MSETEVLELAECEVTNDCTCVVEDDDHEFSPAPECFGDCFEDNITYFQDVIWSPWIERNHMNNATVVRMSYDKMDWDSKAGKTYFQVEELKECEPLKLNGDYILRWKLDGKKLTVTRSSHDEMGAAFVFELMQNYCEICEHEIVNAAMLPDWFRTSHDSCLKESETN